MEKATINLGIDRIEHLISEIASDNNIPQVLSGNELEPGFLTQTEIDEQNSRVSIRAGVIYSYRGQQLLKVEIIATYNVTPIDVAVTINKEQHSVRLENTMLHTLLSSTYGILRGVVFEKTRGTRLGAFYVPLLSMEDLVKNNKIRIVHKK